MGARGAGRTRPEWADLYLLAAERRAQGVPEPQWYRDVTRLLENAYLAAPDVYAQSGKGGGSWAEWELGRRVVVEAVEYDGSFLGEGRAGGAVRPRHLGPPDRAGTEPAGDVHLPPSVTSTGASGSRSRARPTRTVGSVADRMEVAKPIPPAPEGSAFGVNRLTLREILLAGLGDAVRFGKAFDRFDQIDGGRVRARFTDGTTATGDLLVGTDGTGSAVRRLVAPDARLDDLGCFVYGRTVITADTLR